MAGANQSLSDLISYSYPTVSHQRQKQRHEGTFVYVLSCTLTPVAPAGLVGGIVVMVLVWRSRGRAAVALGAETGAPADGGERFVFCRPQLTATPPALSWVR